MAEARKMGKSELFAHFAERFEWKRTQAREFFEYLTHDKGRHRRLTDFGTVLNPVGIRTIGEMPNLTDAMVQAGWPAGKIEKVIGGNWLRVFKDVWGA